MSLVSHQTIKLSPGKHTSPHEGACVMELASMLAGEPFSDHPQCVCPVIGSFLRAYNDSVNEKRRQDLYMYAATAVGSRAGADVQQLRAERLASWSSEMLQRRWTWFVARPLARALSNMRRPPLRIDALGAYAVHSIRKHTEETHAAALSLIEELLAIGDRDRPAAASERSSKLDGRSSRALV
jgi:hypothetical protein